MTLTNRLPTTLCKNGRFCCWRYEERDGKRTKVPYNPRTGGRAQSTNPATFAPLTEAEAAQSRYDGMGVGIFGNLGAIDIDHCISEQGELSPMAAEVMEIMDAYTESSPSGYGLRILFVVPDGFQYNKARYYINNQKVGMEIYIAGSTQKYVTVTGDTFTPGKDLEERGEQLRTVLEKYMKRTQKRPTQTSNTPEGTALDDLGLIERIKRSKKGAAFAALMAGDTSAYDGDDSRADMALCDILAFWTNKNADRMDRIFRTSGLMREKWDRPTAGSTYGRITIQNAIDSAQQGYDPQMHFKAKADKFTSGTAAGSLKLSDLRPETSNRYSWNDIGNGYLFADWYKDVARYAPERKKWFIYDGKVWKPDTGGLYVMELCKKLADALVIYALSLPDGSKKDEYRQFVERWQKRYNRETILKDASSVYPVELAEFDADPYLYNCKNGTLDLRTRQFRPHSAADMLTMISGVKYDPAARCERWEQAVMEVMQGNRENALFLQKAMGYGLTGDTSEECFFMFYGATTRNGKGTLMETYMRLQGDYGRAARPETIAQKQTTANSGAPSEDVARLAGSRVVNISEPGKQMVLSASLVKALTGNDKITARFLNENSFEFYPQFKIFINTNHLPRVTDPTVFSSNRVKVIPFERHFTEKEQDKGLKRKLSQAHSLTGILNWCLDGLHLIEETGFDEPEAIRAATAQYQKDSDKISRFVADMMEPDIMGEIRTEDAYREYQAWCVRNGQYPEAMPAFKQAMEAHATIKRKRPAGTRQEDIKFWFILGLKWRRGQLGSSVS